MFKYYLILFFILRILVIGYIAYLFWREKSIILRTIFGSIAALLFLQLGVAFLNQPLLEALRVKAPFLPILNPLAYLAALLTVDILLQRHSRLSQASQLLTSIRDHLAEGIFRHQITLQAPDHPVVVDSAGLDDYHVGEPPDARTLLVAHQHGITLNHRARLITPEDFQRFDYILAMDRSNLRKLQKLVRQHSIANPPEIRLIRDFDPKCRILITAPWRILKRSTRP